MYLARWVARDIINGDDSSVITRQTLRIKNILHWNIVLMPAVNENKIKLHRRCCGWVLHSMRDLCFVIRNGDRAVSRNERMPPRKHRVNITLRCENIRILT
jgi:hypothetical protein